MHREAVILQLANITSARRAVTVLLALFVCAIAPSSAAAVIQSESFKFTGPGLAHAGREVSVIVSAANVSADPALTPDAIDRLLISSRVARFNGSANGLATCSAALPKNGDPARCPKSSKVGGGKIAGILGTPGQAADMFGALSSVTGNFKLFNYKHPRGQPARMVAVITATKPFPGVAINLVVPVDRKGTISIRVPALSKLPPLIRKSYPRGTKLVLTKFSAGIASPRRRQNNPFLSLRRSGEFDLAITAINR